jgi:hypothetical protein
VNGFAKIAAPLNSLLRKGESPKLCLLTEDQLLSFENLKQCLLSPPILALPKANGQFTVNTDAFSEHIGCCLYQDQPDVTKHPLGYWSRGLAQLFNDQKGMPSDCLGDTDLAAVSGGTTLRY